MATAECAGIREQPLGNFLKALGLLRVVALQRDRGARGHFSGGNFVLTSALEPAALLEWLLRDYRPTPIFSAWNADGGMDESGRPVKELAQLLAASDPRLDPFREAVAVAGPVRAAYGPKPQEGDKAALIQDLRSVLPEEASRWIDAAWAFAAGGAAGRAIVAPMLGSGGVDGRLEFGRLYARSLRLALGMVAAPGRGAPSSAQGWLRAALFGDVGTALVTDLSPGRFLPGVIGGPNATAADEGDALGNPWDIVLLLEGSLLWGGSSVRHLRATATTRAAFPFTFAASAGGPGVSPSETASQASEIWAPVWPRPSGYDEVALLFREGRVEWRERPAGRAIDVARAARSLGVCRGLEAFQRYGMHVRNGKAYLAVALGRYPVRGDERARLLADFDDWLNRLDRSLKARATWPTALVAPRKRLDDAMLEYCIDSRTSSLARCLLTAADLEGALALRSATFLGMQQAGDVTPLPLAPASPAWSQAVGDASLAFRLAQSFAGIAFQSALPSEQTDRPSGPMPVRNWLEAVSESRHGVWNWSPDSVALGWPHPHNVVSLLTGTVERLLRTVIQDSGAAAGGLVARAGYASLADLTSFAMASERRRDADLARWIAALLLVRPAGAVRFPGTSDGWSHPVLVLTKAASQPSTLPWKDAEGGQITVRPEAAIPRLLQAGQARQAVHLAIRRLRASGVPLPAGLERDAFHVPPDISRRMAAALAFPVAPEAIAWALRGFLPRSADDERTSEPTVS